MLTCQTISTGVQFRDGSHLLRIQPIGESILRMTYTGRGDFLDRPGAIVLPQSPYPDFTCDETDSHFRISTGRVTASVDKETGRIQYLDASEGLLSAEPQTPARSLDSFQVYRNLFDFSSEASISQNVDGARASVDEFETVPDRTAYHAILPFEFTETEAIFGLGSHEEGLGNLRGKERHLYQQNMKAVVPFFVSTRGYGYLVDCSSLMVFEDTALGSYLWCECVDELDYYFIAGESFDSVIKQYRQLTGPAPLFPKWLFGYAQSKEKYTSSQELLQVAAEYREREIPLDLIVQDWCSWEEGQWGQKSFDPSRYPDPSKLIEDLHALHTRLMISIWPIMTGDGENRREMLQKGYMLGNQANYDALNPDARRAYWDQAYRGLFRHGLDAWWCDCTEPFENDWSGAVKPQPHERIYLNTAMAKKYMDQSQINAYSLFHSMGIYEGQRQATDEKRVVNLTRSSYAGQHRYGTITWSGDICATWDTLRRQIPEGVNFCASGEPYWTLDIGGFFVRNKPEQWFWSGDYDSGCDDLGYRELYTRWLQYGTFLPVMRSHGTDTPREVWRFGEPGTPFYDTIKKFIELRYRLLPYVYSMAAMTTFSGYTMLRCVALEYPHDAQTYDLTEEYLFGSFLVCPVTHAMYYSAGSHPLPNVPKTQEVYLPSGTRWIDFWTSSYHEGGQVLLTPAPLEQIPLFLPEGTILPMGPVMQYSCELTNPPLTIVIYAGRDGRFLLYDDAGDGYAYERGEYSTIEIRWLESQKTCILGARQGRYPHMPVSRDFLIRMITPEEQQDMPVTYTGQELSVPMK